MGMLATLLLAAALQEGGPSIRLRIVDVDERPLVGVEGKFESTALTGTRKRLSGESNAEGVLELVLGDGALPVGRLELLREGFASRVLVLRKDQATSVRDLGTLVLETAASLDIALVGRDGGLLLEGWSVVVSPEEGSMTPLDAPQVVELRGPHIAGRDAAAGTYRTSAMLPGTYTVTASHPVGVQIGPASIELVSGERRSLVLRSGALVPERMLRIRIQLDGPWPSALRRPLHAVNVATGARTLLEPVGRDDREFLATDVEPGLYRVESDWEPLVGWRSERLETGRRHPVRMPCSASVYPIVVRAGTDEVVEGWSADLLEPRAAELEPGTLALPAGRSLVRIRAPGFAQRILSIEHLGYGEVRRVTVELEPLIELEVRVWREDGRPAEQTIVALEVDGADFPVFGTTDRTGVVRLAGVPPGPLEVRVGVGLADWHTIEAEVQAREPLRVDLPPTTHASVRLTKPSWMGAESEVRVTNRGGWWKPEPQSERRGSLTFDVGEPRHRRAALHGPAGPRDDAHGPPQDTAGHSRGCGPGVRPLCDRGVGSAPPRFDRGPGGGRVPADRSCGPAKPPALAPCRRGRRAHARSAAPAERQLPADAALPRIGRAGRRGAEGPV